MASFIELYSKLHELREKYAVGQSKMEDFVEPLKQLQEFNDPLFACVGYHVPISVQSSLYIYISTEKIETWFGYFDLKKDSDVEKFLCMLKRQTIITHDEEEIMVGPNINGYCDHDYTRQYMNSYGFGKTYEQLYRNS